MQLRRWLLIGGRYLKGSFAHRRSLLGMDDTVPYPIDKRRAAECTHQYYRLALVYCYAKQPDRPSKQMLPFCRSSFVQSLKGLAVVVCNPALFASDGLSSERSHLDVINSVSIPFPSHPFYDDSPLDLLHAAPSKPIAHCSEHNNTFERTTLVANTYSNTSH
ncbi:hypothetical protein C8Q73DRAFT_463310 [Cubamyces lactineus]|nr:hypothetical protein C8Q73DRAFT_463310 [Cubamyces lactineus]